MTESAIRVAVPLCAANDCNSCLGKETLGPPVEASPIVTDDVTARKQAAFLRGGDRHAAARCARKGLYGLRYRHQLHKWSPARLRPRSDPSGPWRGSG